MSMVGGYVIPGEASEFDYSFFIFSMVGKSGSSAPYYTGTTCGFNSVFLAYFSKLELFSDLFF